MRGVEDSLAKLAIGGPKDPFNKHERGEHKKQTLKKHALDSVQRTILVEFVETYLPQHTLQIKETKKKRERKIIFATYFFPFTVGQLHSAMQEKMRVSKSRALTKMQKVLRSVDDYPVDDDNQDNHRPKLDFPPPNECALLKF
jgi:hypothetical protein